MIGRVDIGGKGLNPLRLGAPHQMLEQQTPDALTLNSRLFSLVGSIYLGVYCKISLLKTFFMVRAAGRGV